ncbi:hypothetical protein ACQKWADRAFT_279674 [Trichoderma austrokoningii]
MRSKWSMLPEELRLKVLENLAQSSSEKHGLTKYALVCKSWQSIFEKENFRSLTIDHEDFRRLAKIPERCWPYVKHIWLRISLEEYYPRQMTGSVRPEMLEETAEYNDRIEGTLTALFSILSSWEKVVKPDASGITLELSVHSPSNSTYITRAVHVKGLDMRVPFMENLKYRATVNPEIAASRALGGYVHIRFDNQLPRLQLVKAFLINRHTRRRFSSFTLHQIISKLPNLEYLSYEPWKQPLDTLQDMVDAGYVNLIKGSLPATLKQLVFLEDRDDTMITAAIAPTIAVTEKHVRKPNYNSGVALANKSLGFENLAATFFVEARDFFQAYKPGWTWRNLRTLTLTSYLLDSKREADEINEMLQAAGEAALAMPMLQTLEIWNGTVGYAAIFAYHVERGEAVISWTGTWDLVFTPYIIDVWRRVGYKNHRCEKLGVEKRLIENVNDVRGYVDVVKMLRTKKHVISRQSMDELRYEFENACICFP